jgi:hypothetical protein
MGLGVAFFGVCVVLHVWFVVSFCVFVSLFVCLLLCCVWSHSCGQDDVSHELSMPCIVHEFLEEAPRSILAKLVLASNTCDGGEPQVRSRRECRRMH